MNESAFGGAMFLTLHVLIQIALTIRVLLKPHREPASRIAWVVVIVALPVLGIVAYILLGETNIGRRRVERMHEVLSRLPHVTDAAGSDAANLQVEVPELYAHLFQLGKSINGFEPVGGNRAHLMQDSNATIASLVADIDDAQDHVHLLFYIWLPDNNGCKVVVALKRAAARGVTCRAMPDGLGLCCESAPAKLAYNRSLS
jgi:cardiolipin synthase